MQHMGWGWSEYCDAPADLVDEIGARMAGQATYQREQESLNRAKGSAKLGKR